MIFSRISRIALRSVSYGRIFVATFSNNFFSCDRCANVEIAANDFETHYQLRHRQVFAMALKKGTQCICGISFIHNFDFERHLLSCQHVNFQLPELGFIKLNTDGCRKLNGLAGAGGLIRGRDGIPLLLYSEQLGKASAVLAELRSLERGLTLCKDLGLQKVLVVTDCEKLIGALKKKIIKSPAVDLIDDILEDEHASVYRYLCARVKSLMDCEDWEVKLQHTLKEANRATD